MEQCPTVSTVSQSVFGKTPHEVIGVKKRSWFAAILMAGYLLGVSRGYVAIWQGEDPEPYLVTKMPVALLPLDDVKRLEKGIPIPDDYTLAQALEDFCS